MMKAKMMTAKWRLTCHNSRQLKREVHQSQKKKEWH